MRRPLPIPLPLALGAAARFALGAAARFALGAATLLALGACSESGESGLSPLARDGQRVYQNVCIACHNGDPTVDGSLGPAVAGASQALLEARVIRGEYPPGYEPQRPASNVMPRFEYLEPEIPALAAYLAEVQAAKGDGS